MNDNEASTTVALVRAARDGDRRALDELFERYDPRVRQIVALRTGRRLRQLDELEDITQNALMDAFSGLERFEERSEGGFRNWLARCVESRIRMHVRDAGRKKRGGGRVVRFGDCKSDVLLSSILAGPDPTPSELARGMETAERIESALLELPGHYREVVVLRSLCEMSYSEIAQEMKMGEEAARKAFSRGLAKLKASIEERQ